MKITLPDKEIAFLINLLSTANRTSSIPTEPDVGWRNWIMAPLAQHAVTPVEAKAALTVIGILADCGVPVNKMMNTILETFVENYSD